MKVLLMLSLLFAAEAQAVTEIRCSAVVIQYFQKFKFDYLIKLSTPTQAEVALTTTVPGVRPGTSILDMEYTVRRTSDGIVYTFDIGNYEWTVTTRDRRRGVLFYSEALKAPCFFKN